MRKSRKLAALLLCMVMVIGLAAVPTAAAGTDAAAEETDVIILEADEVPDDTDQEDDPIYDDAVVLEDEPSAEVELSPEEGSAAEDEPGFLFETAEEERITYGFMSTSALNNNSKDDPLEVEADGDEITFYADELTANFNICVMAQEGNTTAVTAAYTWVNTSGVTKTAVGEANGGSIGLLGVIKAGTAGNDVDVVVRKDGVETEEHYTIHIVRKTCLKQLTVKKADGTTVELKPSFDRAVYEYRAVLGEDDTSASILAGEPNTETATISYNGTMISDGSAYTMALQPGVNDLTVKAVKDGVEACEYVIRIIRSGPVKLGFVTDPEEAFATVFDDANNRIFPGEDGRFTIPSDVAVYYTLTARGYVGQSGEITVSEDTDMTFEMDRIPESDLDQLESEWPSARPTADNNGVVNARTPRNAAEVELRWERQMGDYVSPTSGSTQVLINGKLCTMSGNKIYYLNKDSGEILQSADMVMNAGYNLMPVTYADGMIFAPLGNGTIQAFDAATLESLWVYKNEDIWAGKSAGETRSPIYYNDGYIYVGFNTTPGGSCAFVCIDTADEDPSRGTEYKTAVWRVTDNGTYMWNECYCNDNYLFVYSQRGNVSCFNKRTGELMDRYNTGDSEGRSGVLYYNGRIYILTKTGYLYSWNIDADGTMDMDNTIEPFYYGGTSTSTPVAYNNRLYFGCTASNEFGSVTNSIVVVDIDPATGAMTKAYTVPTAGNCQTPGFLTTAYEAESGYVYVYFIANHAKSTLYVIKDKAGMTEADPESGPLFEPPHPQFSLAFPVVDKDGNTYWKNDSAWQWSLGVAEVYLEKIDIQGGHPEVDGGKAFAGTAAEHTIKVDEGTSSIRVDLTANRGTAVYINGEEGSTADIALRNGTADFEVMLERGSVFKNYTFRVISGPSLAGLTATTSRNSGSGKTYTLSPSFDPMTTEYVANIESAQRYTAIYPVKMNEDDVITAEVVKDIPSYSDGDSLTINTNSSGLLCTVLDYGTPVPESVYGRVKITVTDARGGSKDYLVTVSTADAAPVITTDEGAVSDRMPGKAKLNVTVNKNGTLYYLVRPAGAASPDADTVISSGTEAAVTAGLNHITLPGLEPDALKIYLALKTPAGHVSPVTALDIPECGAVFGDINGDGLTDQDDVQELLDSVTAGENISLQIGDLNGDGAVDNADVLYLFDFVRVD